jgi:hypothetical protein
MEMRQQFSAYAQRDRVVLDEEGLVLPYDVLIRRGLDRTEASQRSTVPYSNPNNH